MRFKLSNYRRVIQAFFFLAFFFLLGVTAKQIVLPFSTQLFLAADPLVALATVTAGLPLISVLLYSVVTIAVTLLFGRVFCGYACPMGALLDLFAPLAKLLKVNQESFKKLKALPLIILAALLIATALKTNILMILDPIVLLTRTTAVIVFPGINYLLNEFLDIFYGTPAAGFANSVSTSLDGMLIFRDSRAFLGAGGIAVLFVTIVSLNALGRRFWCRYLCPLGGLLGLFARIPLFRRSVAVDSCTSCLSCAKTCEMIAISKDGLATDASSCLLCLRCRDKCKQEAISWGLKPELTQEIPSRRTAVMAIGASVAAAYALPLGGMEQSVAQTLVRPPGVANEDEFLSKCVRCGQCLKACPTNALQPALLQYGLEAIWTPRLDFKSGICDWECNACTRVCPTGAIKHLTLPEKRKFIIGMAVIDKYRCYPWVAGHGCQVCYDLCPVPDKAILLKDTGKYDPSGVRIVLPYVKMKECIGCGICEANCPVKTDNKGIVIFGKRAKHTQ